MSSQNSSAQVLDYVRRMPSLPTSVSKVLEVCNNPQTSPIDLDMVIRLDPVLMGRVLKLINSAYYSLGNQITSLPRAIILLGINTVKNLVLSSTILDRVTSSNDFKALSMEGFWRHSLCVGVTAKLIAKYRAVDQKMLEEYFAAGLLHDIGKIPLNTALAENYLFAMKEADNKKVSLHISETEILGLNHCDSGKIVSDSWRLRGAIADTIFWHHRLDEYEGENKEVIYTIAIANYFANREQIGFSGNRFNANVSNIAYENLGIKKEVLIEILEPVKGELERAKVFLRITK